MVPGVYPRGVSVSPGEFQRIVAHLFNGNNRVPAMGGLVGWRRLVRLHENRFPLAACTRARVPEPRKRDRAPMSIIPNYVEFTFVDLL